MRSNVWSVGRSSDENQLDEHVLIEQVTILSLDDLFGAGSPKLSVIKAKDYGINWGTNLFLIHVHTIVQVHLSKSIP